MTEEFPLTGTGQFIVYALFDAVWSAPQIGFSLILNTWGGQSGHDGFSVDTSGAPSEHYSISPTGSVTDYLLKTSVDVWEAESQSQFVGLQLNASLAPWSWDAFLDASHTATLFFETAGNLVATPVTPSFLSQSPLGSEPAPVPLSAGFPLLGAGLLALTGLRRAARRRG